MWSQRVMPGQKFAVHSGLSAPTHRRLMSCRCRTLVPSCVCLKRKFHSQMRHSLNFRIFYVYDCEKIIVLCLGYVLGGMSMTFCRVHHVSWDPWVPARVWTFCIPYSSEVVHSVSHFAIFHHYLFIQVAQHGWENISQWIRKTVIVPYYFAW